MPVIVRDIDRNTATIVMVDSNLQRENILPSERAKAYKMKLDAIKRQGARTDLTSAQVAQKLSVEKVAEDAGTSKDQVRRYIRLNELQPELQHLVDEGKIGMTPAVEISYLKPDEQKMLVAVLGIMMEQKKPENWDLKLPMEKIRKFFPRSYTPQRMEETIIKLLETWMKKRQQDRHR